MHCFKSIKIGRYADFYRTFLLSAIISLVSFVILYVPTHLFFLQRFDDQYLFLFLLGVLFMYPFHKLMHILPIIHRRKHLAWSLEIHFFFLPILTFKMKEPIAKKQFILLMLGPFLVINTLLASACILYPLYAHYFMMLLAYHIGLCYADIIYVKPLLFTPKHALIEENENGYEILIAENNGILNR